MIYGVLISDEASQNLLAMHDLREAGVGLEFPVDKRLPGCLKLTTTAGTTATFDIKPKNRLYPIPRCNVSDTPISEILNSSVKNFAGNVHKMTTVTRSELWHARLGHAHPSKIAALSHNCIGIDKPIPDTSHPCHTCMDANIRRSNKPHAATDAPAGTWNLDLVDMGKTPSIGGYRYISIFTIVASRYVIIVLHKAKSDCPDVLRKAFNKAGKTPTVLRTDGAGEYNTKECNDLLLGLQIRKEASNPEEQFQDGDTLSVSTLYPPGVVAYRVAGSSMIDANIVDGDFVIVRLKPQAELGEVVVVFVPDMGTVVKVKRKRHYASANKLQGGELIPACDGCREYGVLVGVIRKY
jgi:hypothetical protein